MLVSFCSSAEVTDETPTSTLTEETLTTVQDTTTTTVPDTTTTTVPEVLNLDYVTVYDSGASFGGRVSACCL